MCNFLALAVSCVCIRAIWTKMHMTLLFARIQITICGSALIGAKAIRFLRMKSRLVEGSIQFINFLHKKSQVRCRFCDALRLVNLHCQKNECVRPERKS
jgi:hypothetical protein